MSTSATPTPRTATPSIPHFSVAGTFLEGLAAQDFDRLGSALGEAAHLRALVPRGLVEFDGAGEIQAAFTRWFGDTRQFELVDAVVGEVGSRLHLRWRLRLQAERLGDGWFVVEQQAYADTGDAGRIDHISLLCTGYCRERSDA